jgi:hypothetical protein
LANFAIIAEMAINNIQETPFPTSHRGTYFVGKAFIKPNLCGGCFYDGCEIVYGDEETITGRVTPSKDGKLPCVKHENTVIQARKEAEQVKK